MKEIKLTRGQVALVDDENFDFLNQWKWYAKTKGKNFTNQFYAARNEHFRNSKGKHSGRTIFMHRVILGIDNKPWREIEADHIDGDTLNNTTMNLRKATRSQNCANKINNIKNRIGKKGVAVQANGRIHASIKVKQKSISLGAYNSVDQAAIAYDNASIIHFKEFARPNF